MEYIGTHVKALKREFYEGVNFLATESILASGSLEAFEAYD